jgi:hypothetical protein
MWVWRAEFAQSLFVDGRERYAAGQHYPLEDRTRSQILAGAATLVRVRMNPLRYLAHLSEQALNRWELREAWRETYKAERSIR